MTQVKKVYRRALRIGKKILSRQISLEEIESFLLKKGLKKKDIKASISLASCLLYFHKLVFPGEEIKIFFCYNEPNSENIASNGKKNYQIAPKGLYNTIKKLNRKILLFDEDGFPKCDFYDLPDASYEEIIMIIAAHEVRHQVQKKGITMFSSRKKYEGKTNTIVQFRKFLFRVKFDYPELKSFKKAKELDARIIEELILSALQDGAEESEICRLIKIKG